MLASINCIQSCPGNKGFIIVSSNNILRLRSLEDGSTLQSFTQGQKNDRIRGVAIKNNGKKFFSVSDDRSIKIWDIVAGSLIKKKANAHEELIFGICLTFEENYLITGDSLGCIKVWTTKDDDLSLKKIFKYAHSKKFDLFLFIGFVLKVIPIAFDECFLSVDGNINSRLDNNIKLWNVNNNNSLKIFRSNGFVGMIVLRSNQQEFFCSSQYSDYPFWGKIEHWRIRDMKLIWKSKQLPQRTNGLVLFDNDRFLISGTADGKIRMWNLAKRLIVFIYDAHRADEEIYLSLSADCKYLVTASEDRSINIIEMTNVELQYQKK